MRVAYQMTKLGEALAPCLCGIASGCLLPGKNEENVCVVSVAMGYKHLLMTPRDWREGELTSLKISLI